MHLSGDCRIRRFLRRRAWSIWTEGKGRAAPADLCRPVPPAERPFTTATLALRWSCSDQHIRDMIARGELVCFRLGKLIRIAAAEVARIESGSGRSPQGVGQPDIWHALS